jgi:hypothetical protein
MIRDFVAAALATLTLAGPVLAQSTEGTISTYSDTAPRKASTPRSTTQTATARKASTHNSATHKAATHTTAKSHAVKKKAARAK